MTARVVLGVRWTSTGLGEWVSPAGRVWHATRGSVPVGWIVEVGGSAVGMRRRLADAMALAITTPREPSTP